MLLRRWAALGGGVLSFVACGGVPTVGPAKTPEFQPANETKCAIVKSHSEPLVVEWPMSDRAKLETLKKTGLIAVQYEGCHMKLLPYCKAPGRYAYDGLDRVLHEKARLGIMACLVANPDGLLFNELKELCNLTDGNLSRHLQLLQQNGFVEIFKGFEKRRPQTLCRFSEQGLEKYQAYLSELERVLHDAQSSAVRQNVVLPNGVPKGWLPV